MWPLRALQQLRNGTLLERDENITVRALPCVAALFRSLLHMLSQNCTDLTFSGHHCTDSHAHCLDSMLVCAGVAKVSHGGYWPVRWTGVCAPADVLDMPGS